MNWGHRIALVYFGFVALIASLIFRTCKENTDLEYSDYYQREVNYQAEINSSTALLNSGVKPEVKVSAADVEIILPDTLSLTPLSGGVTFYRSNDKNLDQTFSLSGARLLVPCEKLVSGLYDVRMNWTSAGIAYSYETTIAVP
jgi:hypothetical protein